MLEPKAPNGTAEVHARFLLLGVEPHTLTDDLLWFAVRTPNRERAFESHGEDALGFQFTGAGTQGVAFTGGGVRGDEAFEVGRDIASHVEALHLGGVGCESCKEGLRDLGSEERKESTWFVVYYVISRLRWRQTHFKMSERDSRTDELDASSMSCGKLQCLQRVESEGPREVEIKK